MLTLPATRIRLIGLTTISGSIERNVKAYGTIYYSFKESSAHALLFELIYGHEYKVKNSLINSTER